MFSQNLSMLFNRIRIVSDITATQKQKATHLSGSISQL
ncbi:hypothetical protein VCHENC03_4845 [Vibrio sp. HENC-03]|nr:hypothetical protein VCHENC03_4845 [Vibrio sp. HENC-03]